MFPHNHAYKPYICVPANEHVCISCVCAHTCRVYRLRRDQILDSRLCLHEGHAGGLVVVRVDGWHHLAADWVEDRQGGEGPRDLPVLRHAPQLLAGLLDGAVVNQLDAGETRGSGVNAMSSWCLSWLAVLI